MAAFNHREMKIYPKARAINPNTARILVKVIVCQSFFGKLE